jgi:hypothetical protein
MPVKLMFWKAPAGHRLSAEEIGRELTWGEEVEGLIDLPIKEILDRLKSEFSEHREAAGLFVIHAAGGQAEATWTWQHIRFELQDESDHLREQLVRILAEFGCTAHETP